MLGAGPDGPAFSSEPAFPAGPLTGFVVATV